MAKEETETAGLEVDNSYHSVVNSWFGNDDSNNKKHAKDDDSVTNGERESKKAKKKRKSSGEKVEDEDSPKKSMGSFPSGLKKITQNISSFISEKLSKKMKKNKWKEDEKAKDHETVIKPEKIKDSDLEADSKTAAVSKLSKSAESDQGEHSVDSLKQRLESTNLSQSARKRLKKRLNKMIHTTDGEKRASDAPEISLATGNKNKKDITDNEKEKKKVDSENDSVSLKRKISDKEENSDKEEDISPKKRKRAKKRSKQKNIKKDNRPDHLKPPHLQKAENKDEKDENSSSDDDDDTENNKSNSFTNILPSKKQDGSKKKKTDGKPAIQTGGKLPKKTKDGKKGKKLQQTSTVEREDPHTIESLTERLKETDLTKSTRKRLMRRLLSLKNEGKNPVAGKKNIDEKEKNLEGGKNANGDMKDKEHNKVKKRKHQNKEDTPVTNNKSIQEETSSSPKKKKKTEEVEVTPVQKTTPNKKKNKKKSVKTEDD